MSRSIIRECGRFNITPETPGNPTMLTVGETWRKINADSRPMVLDDTLSLARKIRPHLQHTSTGYDASKLAINMAAAKGWSVAYCGYQPNTVLAFAHIHRLNVQPSDIARALRFGKWPHAEYAFGQIGVTTNDDTLTNREDMPLAQHRRAVAAIIHCAISTLDEGAAIHVAGYPRDTRRRLLFTEFGFRQSEPGVTWGEDHVILSATVGSVQSAMRTHADAQFLKSPLDTL